MLTSGDPPRWTAIAGAAVALLVVLNNRLWPLARHVITIAHEGGHALAAVGSGRRVGGIRLHSDTSGVTVSAGRPTGPGVVITVAAGYITPSILGLGGAALLAANQVSLLLRLSVALLLGVLVAIRNAFGVLSIALSAVTVIAVSMLAPSPYQEVFAAFVTWFLLIGGVRPIVEVQRTRRRGAPTSDPDQLARLTGVPGVVWVAFFALVSVFCLAVSVEWLLR
ncbi:MULTISPECIES: M50 family metallopeptidase [unclassified Frankia]|uniref:M50 family metallopeptidase n=1 Tax=unclassified Frankia TaxID=2632575 RepID=UPI002AD513AE|nr:MULTISPECIES: M50 family metallopeptidase [unclassified Frankia]